MKRLLIIPLMALSSIPGNSQTKKVIFVCEHGAWKSVVAAAYFNKIAKDRNVDWEASCRGTNPDEEVSAATKEGLTSDNLLDPTLSPQKLAPNDTSNVEKIILFTKLPDDFKTTIKSEDWSSLPNIDAKYEVRRDALIKKKMNSLTHWKNKIEHYETR